MLLELKSSFAYFFPRILSTTVKARKSNLKKASDIRKLSHIVVLNISHNSKDFIVNSCEWSCRFIGAPPYHELIYVSDFKSLRARSTHFIYFFLLSVHWTSRAPPFRTYVKWISIVGSLLRSKRKENVREEKTNEEKWT